MTRTATIHGAPPMRAPDPWAPLVAYAERTELDRASSPRDIALAAAIRGALAQVERLVADLDESNQDRQHLALEHEGRIELERMACQARALIAELETAVNNLGGKLRAVRARLRLYEPGLLTEAVEMPARRTGGDR